MRQFLKISAVALVAATASGTAYSQVSGSGTCNFAAPAGTCTAIASPALKGSYLQVTSGNKCAAIDYQANGRVKRLFVASGAGTDETATADVAVVRCTAFANAAPVAAPVATYGAGFAQPGFPASTAGIPRVNSIPAGAVPISGAYAQSAVTASTTVSPQLAPGLPAGVTQSTQGVIPGTWSGSAPQAVPNQIHAGTVTTGLVQGAQHSTFLNVGQPQAVPAGTPMPVHGTVPVHGAVKQVVHAPVPQPVVAAPQPAPVAVATASGIEGRWCSERGYGPITVSADKVALTRTNGAVITAPFTGVTNPLDKTYRFKSFGLYTGRIAMTESGRLYWQDKVSPGIESEYLMHRC